MRKKRTGKHKEEISRIKKGSADCVIDISIDIDKSKSTLWDSTHYEAH